MKYRGTYKFEVNSDETIINSDRNAELLRKLWLDKEIIKPNALDLGSWDFDNGAWHVACHLVAAGCVKNKG